MNFTLNDLHSENMKWIPISEAAYLSNTYDLMTWFSTSDNLTYGDLQKYLEHLYEQIAQVTGISKDNILTFF